MQFPNAPSSPPAPLNGQRLWRLAGYGLLWGLSILVILTFRDYGNGFDAQVQDVYGRDILHWFESGGRDLAALKFRDLYFYGGWFDATAALINSVSPFAHWATRHLLEAGCGLLGLAGAWRLARRLAGDRAGFLALSALALMPSYYGMMFINPKDIPFAAASVWSVFYLTRIAEELPQPRWRHILGFGAFTGLALGTRIAGVLLVAYCVALLAADLLVRARAQGWTARRAAHETLLHFYRVGLPALLIAWAVMIALWPWALVSPLDHPWEALAHFSGLANGIDTLYFGRHIGTGYHPPFYLPVYLTIKLPDVMVAALILASAATVAGGWRGLSLRHVPVLLAAVFPLIYVMIESPELYDAERHFLFLLPALAVLAGVGLDAVFRRLSGRMALTAALTALLAGGSLWQIRANLGLHPYEYAFFNDLVGGTAGAKGRFDTEYWGTSLAEATDDLRHYIVSHGLIRKNPWKVAISGEATQIGDTPHPHLQITDQWNQADFYISSTRGATDRWLPGKVIDRVTRDGVPFAVIKDLRGTQHAGGSDAKIHG